MDQQPRFLLCNGDGAESATRAPSALSCCPIQAAVETAAAIATTTTTPAYQHSTGRQTGSNMAYPFDQLNVQGHSFPQRLHNGGSSSHSAGAAVSGVGTPAGLPIAPKLQIAPTPVIMTTNLPPQSMPFHQQSQHNAHHSSVSTAGSTSALTLPTPAATLAPITVQQPPIAPALSLLSTRMCLTPNMMLFPYAQMVNGTVSASTVAAEQSMGIPSAHLQHQQMLLSRPSHTIPQILPRGQMLKHRSGKWTLEEEDYATILIDMFEKGQVPNEKNGVTLRSFLSRKLFCAPMRISKKYAGKGIGKKVFISKVNSLYSDTYKADLPELYANLARMMEAEFKFLRAAFPELQALLFPLITGPYVSDNHIPIASHEKVAPPMLSTSPTILQPIASKGDDAPAIKIKGVTHVKPNCEDPSNQPFVSVSPSDCAITCFDSSSNPVVSKNPVTLKSQHQLGSHVPTFATDHPADSLGGAVHSKGSVAGVVNLPTNPNVGICQHVTLGERLCLPPAAPPALVIDKEQAEKQQHEGVGALQRLHEAYVSSILKQATSLASDGGAEDLKMHFASNAQAKGVSPERRSPPTPEIDATSSTHHDGMPDFLSRFDEVSGRMASEQHLFGDCGPYSPTYTTESFDDLHQLLGKNLTPLTAEGQTDANNDATAAKPILPQIQTLANPGNKKRVPQSNLHMRPFKRSGPWNAPRGEVGTIAEDGEQSSELRSMHNTCDPSAHFQGRRGRDTPQQEHLLGREFELDGVPLNDLYGTYDSNAPFIFSRSTLAAVSDPSESTGDDVNSGNESGNLADSDETQSEGSVHRAKGDKSTSGDYDDDVRSWYRTLVQGPQE